MTLPGLNARGISKSIGLTPQAICLLKPRQPCYAHNHLACRPYKRPWHDIAFLAANAATTWHDITSSVVNGLRANTIKSQLWQTFLRNVLVHFLYHHYHYWYHIYYNDFKERYSSIWMTVMHHVKLRKSLSFSSILYY